MNRTADALVIGGFIFATLAMTLCGLAGWSSIWVSIAAWSIWITYVIYAFVAKNELFKKLLILTIVSMPLQLLTDAYHVRLVKTLVYDQALFRLWETPDYILVGWACNVFVQLGYVVLRLTERIKPLVLAAMAAPVGAIAFSWYEEMASRGRVWHYENAALLGYVSYWVIVSFAAIFGVYAWMVLKLRDRPLRWWALGGVFLGLWIFVSSAIAVALFR